MDDAPRMHDAPRMDDPSQLIEIAGPAGCGKTTLVEAMATKTEIRSGIVPCDRSCLPLFIRLLPLLPAGFLRNELRHRRSVRDTVRSMVYLESWLRASPEPGLTLFDHGPFFRLATLRAFGPFESPGFVGWWESMRAAWSERMTLVVWLDAPNDVLVRRIRTRDRAHACKTMEDDEAAEWLDGYRDAFDSALEVLAGIRRADIVRYDTSALSADAIAASLCELLEARRA